MNGIGQQAKAYVSPFPTKFMTDQNKRIYKVPNTGFRKYIHVCELYDLQGFH